ncbi:Hypothetical predicted protein [Mytilus galloprovincialis]|uniref:Uncharacterized protein n=1 Tax=Mytilus galloprovincialis TaxID=29158 RepID=A0A8B6G3B2_MYTGA|nr:Hypothetical predicted protein [Mytilus galloprovincialis]
MGCRTNDLDKKASVKHLRSYGNLPTILVSTSTDPDLNKSRKVDKDSSAHQLIQISIYLERLQGHTSTSTDPDIHILRKMQGHTMPSTDPDRNIHEKVDKDIPTHQLIQI